MSREHKRKTFSSPGYSGKFKTQKTEMVPVLKPGPRRLPIGITGLAVIVFLIGIATGLSQWHSNQVITAHAAKLVYDANHNISHQAPATVKPAPSAFANYQVAPDEPRYIFIPSINIAAIIGQLGLTAEGQLGSPDNVYDTDWYNGSSLPGRSGATVIDGHVSSWTADGVFYNLKLLQPGAKIQIEKGDGTLITYQVVTKQIYNYQNVDMKALLAPVNPGSPGLNLITCTGEVIPGTNEFNQRLVVFATIE